MDIKHPLILSMDTATPCSCVALTAGTTQNGTVLASLTLAGNVTHSRRLLSAIDFLLKETEVDWSMIGGIGVSLGPGSFTGLRIGMATAKGLAAAADKPLFGVSTLDALAATCVGTASICSVLDARKKEVYAAFYRSSKEGAQRISEITVVPPEQLAALIDESIVMVGDGVRVYGELFKELLGEKVSFAPSQLHIPSASSLGMIAGKMLEKGDYLDLADCVPIYIRSSDAELNLLKKKGEKKVKISQ